MRNLLSELKERRFWRVLVAYPSVSFVFLQVVEFFINNYELDARYLTASMIAAAVLLPAAIVWNWRHGEAGEQPFSRTEFVTYVANVIVAAIAVSWYWSVTPEQFRTAQTPLPAARTLAVMPFAVSAGSEDLQYLGDGIAESLINWLARVPDVKVASRSASFRERGKGKRTKEIADALDVDGVLTGTLELSGDYIAVAATLVDVRDDSTIWGERFQSPLGDAISLERSIVDAIKKSLRIVASDTDEQVSASGGTSNAQAYESYQRGHYLIQSTDPARINTGLEELRKAISLDPNFGLPYADIADALSQQVFYGVYDNAMLLGEARSAAYSAVALAPNLPEAHVALATMHQYLTFDWDEVTRAYEKAMALNPQNAAPYHRYADFLWTTLRFKRAQEVAQLGLDSDPLDSNSMHAVGISYMIAGEFAKAAEAFGEWNRFYPQSRWSYVKHSVALSLNGECDQARDQVDRVLALINGQPSTLMDAWIAWGYSVCGADERYAAIKKRFVALLEENPDSPDPALIYYYLIEGNRQGLAHMLEYLADTKSPFTMFLPIFTLDYMGWSKSNSPEDDERIRAVVDSLNFPPNDLAL